MRFRSFAWLAGLPVALALGAAAVAVLEPGLSRRQGFAGDVLAAALVPPGGEPWLMLAWSGRDVRAEGDAPDAQARDLARRRLASLPDVRAIEDRIGIVTRADPFVWTATRLDETAFATEGHRPAEFGRAAFAARLAPSLPASARLEDRSHAAQGASPDFATRAGFAIGLLRRLAPGATATLDGSALAITGAALSASDAAALDASLASPPTGLSVTQARIDPPAVSPFTWTASRTADGTVRLDGYVTPGSARSLIAAAARAAAEPSRMVDSMRAASGLPAGIDAGGLGRIAGRVLALLAEGRIALSDRTLSVSGQAVDSQAVAEVTNELAASLPGAGLVPGEIALSARPVAPYRTQIRREPDRVVLSGHLPDEASRQAVLEALRTRFFGERIVDRLRVAPGAPEGLLAALTAGLDGLALLRVGQIGTQDGAIRLTGESLYRETARRLRTPLAVPAGWSASGEVRGPATAESGTPEACRARLAKDVPVEALRFAPGDADLRPASYPALDALATIAGSCPALRIAVAGYPDPPGTSLARPPVVEPGKSPTPAKPDKSPTPAKSDKSPKPDRSAKAPPRVGSAEAVPQAAADPELPRRRALAVVDYLLKAGVAAERPVVADPAEAAREVAIALRP